MASRVIQGVGAALMMPATLSIVTNAFEPHERGKAIGTWAGVSALALAIGPVLGGLLTEHVSWRAIFYLNIPVAVGAVVATLFAVRESRDESVGRRIDFLGVGTLTAGLTALVLALIEGNAWGWGSPAVVALFATSVAMTIAFFVIERRVPAPIIELPLFRSRNFIGANLIALVVTFAMLSQFFFITLYLQDILGYSPVEAGLRFLPATLMIVIVAPLAGRLTDRVGPRWLIGTGLVLVSVSLYWLTTIGVGTGYADIWPSFVLMGLGMALVMSPMSTAAMNAVSVSKAGVASGILSMNRMVGGTLGIAVIGAVFASQAPAGTRDPAEFVHAFSSSMWVATAVAAVGAVIAVALLRGRAAPAPTVAESEAAATRPASSRPASCARPSRRSLARAVGIQSAGQLRRSARSSRGRTSTSTRPSAAIAARLDSGSALVASRPRRHHDHRRLEPRRAHRLDREQRVVDRPETGGRRDHHPQAEVDGPGRGPGKRASAGRGSRRRPRPRARRRPARRPRRPACRRSGRSARRRARRQMR